MMLETGDGVHVEQAPLCPQRLHRGWGQGSCIGGIDRALVALGHHVQGDRLRGVRPEPWCDPSGPDRLVVIVIDCKVSTPTLVARCNKVSDVVEEGCCHQCVGCPSRLSQFGALQGMTALVDHLAMTLATACDKDRHRLLDCAH